MTWTRAIEGRDLIAALVVGGFRISRREHGLALLVKDVETIVIREESLVEARRIAAILERIGAAEEELESWLAAAMRVTRATVTRSGFQKRVATGDIEDAIARSRDLMQRIQIKK